MCRSAESRALELLRRLYREAEVSDGDVIEVEFDDSYIVVRNLSRGRVARARADSTVIALLRNFIDGVAVDLG